MKTASLTESVILLYLCKNHPDDLVEVKSWTSDISDDYLLLIVQFVGLKNV
jgi:hypothetical protein